MILYETKGVEDLSSHELPSGFKDEEKWFKFFSKRSFIILGVTFAITIFLVKFFELFGLGGLGGVIGGVIMVVFVGLSMVPVPYSDYMKGGGQTFDRRIFKAMLRKRKKSKVIYIKRYRSAADVVEDAEYRRLQILEEAEEE